MKTFDISKLSAKYAVRALGPADAALVFALCAGNPQFYRYSPAEPSERQVLSDMAALPPGIPPSRKVYVGFFEGDALVAVMDVVDGYPDDATAFIGFFMVARAYQGRGVGGAIVAEALAYLKALGYAAARLCIDEGNPQSNAFWKKQGFHVLRRVARDVGSVLLAEKALQ